MSSIQLPTAVIQPLTNDPVLDQACQGLYNDFMKYLQDHKDASGNDLGAELNTLRKTYSDFMNSKQDWSGLGVFNNYADAIQKQIIYPGPTVPSTIPAPNGGNTPQQQIQSEYDSEEAAYKALDQLHNDYTKLCNDFNAADPATKAKYQTQMNDIENEMEQIQKQLDQLPDEEKDFDALYQQAKTETDPTILLKILGEMKESPFAKTLATLTQTTTGWDTSISNLNEEVKSGSGPTPTPGDDVTQIDGYSIQEEKIDGVDCAFPISTGTQGDSTTQTISEAFGYAMRHALDTNQPDLFQRLLNAYSICCKNSLEKQNHIGLMGWLVNMKDGTTTGTADPTTAPDGDSDIIKALMDASKKWPNLTTVNCNPSVSGDSMSIKDLTMDAIHSFAQFDIGKATSSSGKTYDPVLTHDSWGGSPAFSDYFDPTTFAQMYDYVKDSNPTDAQRLKDAATNTMAYVSDNAAANGGWISCNADGRTDGEKSFYQNGEATRSLMRLGEYLLAYPDSDPLGIKAKLTPTLSKLVDNITTDPQFSVNGQSGALGGMFTGPLLIAIDGLLKANPADQKLASLKTQVEAQLKSEQSDYEQHYKEWKKGSPSTFPSDYFSAALVSVAKDIDQQYGA